MRFLMLLFVWVWTLTPVAYGREVTSTSDTVPALQMTEGSIRFTATVNNAPSRGKFQRFNAEIAFDPERLAASKVLVNVDISSVTADYEEVATDLVKPQWFDAETYPTATFETRSFRHLEGNQYEAEADLTLRGKTHPVTLTFTLLRYDASGARMTGQTTLSRTAFGIGQGDWSATDIVKDEVLVEVAITAER